MAIYAPPTNEADPRKQNQSIQLIAGIVSSLGPKAWAYVTQSAGTYTLAASSNIASINKTGTGVVEVNLTTAMSSTSYAVLVNTTDTSIIVQANAQINSASKVTVAITRSSTEAATDAGFSIVMFGA